MHYYALVEVHATATDIHAAVETLMAPHKEEYTEEAVTGFWDWWQIGGRWTGELSGYNPQTDRVNMELCWLCGGSGRREDEVATTFRRDNPDYGCNGCDDTGIALKWPTDWKFHPGDIQVREQISDEHMPYTLVTSQGVTHRKTWDGSDFRDTSEAHTAHWNGLGPLTRLVVVDYHR